VSCILSRPEVSTATAGAWRKISYEKSDAWSTGAIAYEIMGERNPFISANGQGLDARTYEERNLPSIDSLPPALSALVHGLLRRKPSERLSAEMAATICHIYLWGPTRWLQIGTDRVPDSEV
jgi:serine/threonine protein kinase